MSNLRLLFRGSVNFAVKSEYSVPQSFTQAKLLIDLSVANTSKLFRGNSNYFGSLQPILFIPTLGFTKASFQSLRFDKNLIDIDKSVSTNYRLVVIPSRKIKADTSISIYEILSTENPMLYPLSGNPNPVSSSGKNTPVAIAATVTPLVEADPSRLSLTLQNRGAKTVYVGFTNAVTVANSAIAIPALQAHEFPTTYTGALWAISASGTQSVNVVEMF
jgi:hypothetical protein